jgi:AcrR family transcriptional regulator
VSEARLNQRKIPQQRRAEATVASIIEAAARILEHQGLEGYNTNAVARLAGISVGSLYQYFPHKDAITRALLDRESSYLIGVLERIVEDSRGMAAINRIMAAIVTHLMRRPNFARILDDQEQKLSLQDHVLKIETRVQSLIQICLSDGAYAALPDKPTIVFDMICIIRGIVDGAAARGERDIEHIIGRVVRAVEGYFAQSTQCPG